MIRLAKPSMDNFLNNVLSCLRSLCFFLEQSRARRLTVECRKKSEAAWAEFLALKAQAEAALTIEKDMAKQFGYRSPLYKSMRGIRKERVKRMIRACQIAADYDRVHKETLFNID